jgi:isopropylmalate/homocitrate/citramalate synthase
LRTITIFDTTLRDGLAPPRTVLEPRAAARIAIAPDEPGAGVARPNIDVLEGVPA